MKSQHLLWLPALLLTKQEGALAPLLPQSSPQRFRDEKGMSGSHWSHAVERCDRQHSRSSAEGGSRDPGIRSRNGRLCRVVGSDRDATQGGAAALRLGTESPS